MTIEAKTDRKQSDQTRDRLICAGLDLLTRKGYKGATTREIALAAGVTEVTMYRHFRSKEELFITAVEEKGKRFLELVPQPSGDVEADLLKLAVDFLEHLSGLPAQIIRIFPELTQHEELRSAVEEVLRKFSADVLSLFRYYQIAGEIKRDVENVLFFAFIGPLHLSLLSGRSTEDFDCHKYVKLFLEGYRIIH